MWRSLYFLLSLIAVSACTQAPAQVQLRGSENFSQRSAAPTRYSAPVSTVPAVTHGAASAPVAPAMHVDAATVNSARIGSVGVSDLPPPQKKASPNGAQATPPKTPQQLAWPVHGKVTEQFGPHGKGKANDGIVIAAAGGEPVYAAADGEIAFVGDQLKGYGNMVIMKHANGRHTTYAYLGRAAVSRYDRVRQGDIIGYVGTSGDTKEPQLYFAVQDGAKPVDPMPLLPVAFSAAQ